MPRFHTRPVTFLIGIACLFVCFSSAAFAQTSTITYQGRLADAGTPANGAYDLQFKLYDALTSGNLQGSPNTVTKVGVTVTNGVFTVQLDFGAAAFPGADRFLDIGVKHPADSSYTPLLPRQQLTSTPYAIRSASAATADTATTATTANTATNNVLKSGDTMAGELVLSGNPTVSLGAAPKQYVDSGDALKLNLSGGTMSGAIDMGSNKITHLATPTNGTDAANKSYVDGAVPTAGNYVFVYDTNVQSIPVPNTFFNVFFNTTAQINGWTYNAGTGSFTCPQTGLYLIQYTGSVHRFGGGSAHLALRAVVNGAEVPGSQSAALPSDAISYIPSSKSFIASLNASDVLGLQFAGSSTSMQLAGVVVVGTTIPSISMTIVKIQ